MMGSEAQGKFVELVGLSVMDKADKEGRFISDFVNFPSGRGIVDLIWLRYKAEELYGCFKLCQMETHAKSPSPHAGLQRAAKSVWFYWTKGYSWRELRRFCAPKPIVSFERAVWRSLLRLAD